MKEKIPLSYTIYMSECLGLLKNKKFKTISKVCDLPSIEKSLRGEYITTQRKSGMFPTILVKIIPVEIYTRSIKYKLKFDKYSIEQIYFISPDMSPNDIIQKFNKTIKSDVYKKLYDEDRLDDIHQWSNETVGGKFLRKISEKFKTR